MALRAGQARFQEAFDLLATAVPPAEARAGKKRGINWAAQPPSVILPRSRPEINEPPSFSPEAPP